MTFDLSWALSPVESWDGRFLKRWTSRERSATSCFRSWFSRRGSSVVVLPLEVFDLLTGGVSHRVPGETLFPRFHEASPKLAEGSFVQA